MSLPTLRERAEQTLVDIERRFALGDGHYRERENGDGPAFAWAHGVLFSAFVAAAAHLDRKKYLPRMRHHFHALGDYWRTDGPVPGYNASRNRHGSPDRYYDDNAWLALSFRDAYALTGDAAYERAARAALSFVLSGYDTRTGGGLYWHEQNKKSKQAASTAPGAVAALGAGESVWARRLYAWLRGTLRDPADGLYWDNIRVADGRIERTQWSYNSALVLRLELDLARCWRAPVYRERAVTLADSCLTRWYEPSSGLLRDDAAFAHLLAEALLQAHAATGIARYRDAVRTALDALWTRVRRADGSYPKRWETGGASGKNPMELLWIASAARAYAYAAGYLEGKRK